jgi:hypothetical protein
MYFTLIYENRRMKPVETVLRKSGKVGKGRPMEGINLRHIVSTYVNITMYPPVQTIIY